MVSGTDCVDAEREVANCELEVAAEVAPEVFPASANQGSYVMWNRTLQQSKRYLRIVSGFVLLIAGAVMFFTPAPGWMVILLALGILAAEYVWARVLLDRMKEQGTKIRDFVLPRQHPDQV
ncbi:MAG: PGPGW domain-containing protein [Candidatus Acidiferrales bacterium]